MTKFYEQPLRLVWNKLVRYPGGREIDRFRGIYPGADDGRPEAWVGSCARVINAAELEDKNEGMEARGKRKSKRGGSPCGRKRGIVSLFGRFRRSFPDMPGSKWVIVRECIN